MVALNFVEWSIDEQSNGELFQSLIVLIVMQTMGILPLLGDSWVKFTTYPLYFR